MLNLSDIDRIKGFRFPRSVIACAVWACHRFALNLRESRISWRPAGSAFPMKPSETGWRALGAILTYRTLVASFLSPVT